MECCKLSVADKKHQNSKEFIELRHKHSAIESGINALEVYGLDRCPDRGVNIRVGLKTAQTMNCKCLDSALGSFDPACEQAGSSEDGVLSEYLPA